MQKCVISKGGFQMENSMNYAPIVLFVYNRPNHTEKTLISLNGLKEASETELYIFSDAPKSKMALDDVEKVRNLIFQFKDELSNFKNTYIVVAESNKGLAKSIIEGVTDVINKYGRVIVVEDDLEVSRDFLQYMNGALDYYEQSEKIWSISGYTFPMKSLSDYPCDVYLSGRGCSWGWATWKDRWGTVDWNVSDYSSFKFNFEQRRKFSLWGKDLPYMLDAYMFGEIHSWAIRWCYAAFKQDKYTVYPKISRVVNHGTDGTGTNFESKDDKYDTQLFEGSEKCEYCIPVIDKRVRKEFANKYFTKLQHLKSFVRWTFIRLVLLRRR